MLDALVKQEFFYPSYDEANRHQTPWEMVAVMYHRVRGFIAACEVRRRRGRERGWGIRHRHTTLPFTSAAFAPPLKQSRFFFFNTRLKRISLSKQVHERVSVVHKAPLSVRRADTAPTG